MFNYTTGLTVCHVKHLYVKRETEEKDKEEDEKEREGCHTYPMISKRQQMMLSHYKRGGFCYNDHTDLLKHRAGVC